ncbi:hypothetical protein ES702_02120 [subsurface metagenome]
MNNSIALLTVVILHLTILVLSIKEYSLLVRLVIPMHFLPIFLCIITTLAYLFEKELSLFQLNIINMAICFNNIPKYLFALTLIIIFMVMRRSWIIVFAFYDEISKSE